MLKLTYRSHHHGNPAILHKYAVKTLQFFFVLVFLAAQLGFNSTPAAAAAVTPPGAPLDLTVAPVGDASPLLASPQLPVAETKVLAAVTTCYALALGHSGLGADPAASPAQSLGCAAGQYVAGESISLSGAAPADGWQISGWRGTESDTSTTATNSLTMPAAAASVMVDYEQIPLTCYALTLGHTGQGADPVASQPQSTGCTAGHYLAGEIIGLSGAAPADGWQISGWTGTASDTSKTATNLLTIPAAAASVTVNYEPISTTCYALTLGHTGQGADPAASLAQSTGCTTGHYLAGEIIGLSGAAPATGWQINGWTGTASDTSKTATNSLTMPAADRAVSVDYTQIEYTLTVNSAHGTVNRSKDAPYHYGDVVTLTMGTVVAGYTFTGWSEAGCTGITPCQVTIQGDKTVTASFTQNTYSLTVTSAHGTVGRSKDAPYHYGDVVTLTMGTVANGYTFTGWSEAGCTGITPCQVTIQGDKTVTASFTQNTYDLTVTSAHGTVNRSKDAPYHYGDVVTLTMGTVANGYTFTGWSEAGCTGTSPCQVTIQGDKTVTASFTQNTYSLTVTSAHGTVGRSKDAPYHYGDVVTLTMGTVVAGYTFTGWSEAGCTGITPCQVTIQGDKTVTASFTQNIYSLSITSVHGTVNADIPAPYHYGDVVTLTIGTVDAGYAFTSWSGSCTGTGSCIITMNGNKSVTAQYASTTIATISGNAVLAGTTITYTGGLTTTNSSGDYSFTVPLHWSGSVSAFKAGYTFSPASLPFADVTSDQTGQDFTPAVSTTTDVLIARTLQGSYDVPSGGIVTPRYPGLMDGPVEVIGPSNFFTSQRALYGPYQTFNEVMGYPNNKLTTKYYFPWYDDASMQTWILVGNPDPNPLHTATVHITIGGHEVSGSPFTIAGGANITPEFPGLMDGPVVVSSNVNVFASERALYGPASSFNEVMGYPDNQLTTKYYFPWYDDASMQTWILVGNPDPNPLHTATVHITIGGAEVPGSPFTIAGGANITPHFPGLMDGPVVVSSDINIFTSERALYGPYHTFNEVMGYPDNQLTTQYYFPWYDGISMQTWILVGNPDPNPAHMATVHIKVHGVEMPGSPFHIAGGANITPQFAGVMDGPVEVSSDINVFASERALSGAAQSFNEVMGYPSNQLTNTYWFPWYDDASMKTWVLIGKP